MDKKMGKWWKEVIIRKRWVGNAERTVQHVVLISPGLPVGFPGTILFPTNTTHNNVHSTTLVRTFLRIGMRTEGKGSWNASDFAPRIDRFRARLANHRDKWNDQSQADAQYNYINNNDFDLDTFTYYTVLDFHHQKRSLHSLLSRL